MAEDEVTKAQGKLLQWMRAHERHYTQTVNDGRMFGFRGGDLIEYYAEQNKLKPNNKRRGGGYANHGWRRAGGTALKNLSDRGFIDFIGFGTGTPLYTLNEIGRMIADHLTALEESVLG